MTSVYLIGKESKSWGKKRDNGLGELEPILVTRWFSSSIEYSVL